MRKILEVRIADLTKEKTNLGVLCGKHETRIKALEHTESDLANAQKVIKANISELSEKNAAIVELENAVSELHDEISTLKGKIAEKNEQMGLLNAQINVLREESGHTQVVLQEKDNLIQSVKIEHRDVSEERDHFQVDKLLINVLFDLFAFLKFKCVIFCFLAPHI